MRKSEKVKAQSVLLETLRDSRQKAEITQRQLAHKLGKTQSFVSKIEQGELGLEVIQLRELCLALGTTLPRMVEEFEKRLSAKQQKL